MKKQKVISTIFLIFYSIFLILIITFGTNIANYLYNKLNEYISTSNNKIIENLDIIVSKYFGHMGLFFLLSFFSFYFIHYNKTKKIFLNISIFYIIGLFLALITEGIQLFIPYRNASYTDVIIDMIGYNIGFLFVLYANYLIRVIKKR